MEKIVLFESRDGVDAPNPDTIARANTWLKEHPKHTILVRQVGFDINGLVSIAIWYKEA